VPGLTRLLLRTALIHLIAALVLADLEAAALAGWAPAALATVRPVWIHLLVVGFATQLILGVAHWMFPRHPSLPPRGHERALVWAYGVLNAGLLIRAVAEPLARLGDAPHWPVGVLVGGVLQTVALLAFIANAWPRVRER